MRQRLAGMMVAAGVLLLVAARLLTPGNEVPSYLPNVLINVGVALFIFVPLYLAERRLSREVQEVKARLNRELAAFVREREAATTQQVQMARTDLQAALQALQGEMSGGNVSRVIALASDYGTWPSQGVRVRLPSARSFLWLVIRPHGVEGDDGNENEGEKATRLAAFIYRGFGDSRNFAEEIGWWWNDDRVLDSLMGQEIYNWLAKNNEYPGDADFTNGNVPLRLLQVLSLPLQTRAGLSRNTSARFEAALLAVVNEEWAIAEDGLVSLRTEHRIPARVAVRPRLTRRTLRREPWVRKDALEEALNHVHSTPRARANHRMWYPSSEWLILFCIASIAVAGAALGVGGRFGIPSATGLLVSVAVAVVVLFVVREHFVEDYTWLQAALSLAVALGASGLVMTSAAMASSRSDLVSPVGLRESWYVVVTAVLSLMLLRAMASAAVSKLRNRSVIALL